MKNRVDVIGGGLLCALSIGTGIGSIFLKIGSPTEPQPGFFPFSGSLILFLFSLVIVFQGCLGRQKEKQEAAIGDKKGPMALVAVMGILVAVLNPLGYVISTFIASGLILLIMGVKSWRVLLITSLCLSVGTYMLFDKLLGVELPVGFLANLGL